MFSRRGEMLKETTCTGLQLAAAHFPDLSDLMLNGSKRIYPI